jgi:hypothetical protein
MTAGRMEKFICVYETRLKRIESKIAREAVSKTQNTSKTQTCPNLFNMIQIVTIHMILKHV